MSLPLRDAAGGTGILIQSSNIEGQNVMGVEERYHDPLRQLYTAYRLRERSLRPDDAVHIPINDIRNTMGPNGLLKLQPVFGPFP